MSHSQHAVPDDAVIVEHSQDVSCVVIGCEHASCFIPDTFADNMADWLSESLANLQVATVIQ